MNDLVGKSHADPCGKVLLFGHRQAALVNLQLETKPLDPRVKPKLLLNVIAGRFQIVDVLVGPVIRLFFDHAHGGGADAAPSAPLDAVMQQNPDDLGRKPQIIGK